MSSGSSSGIVSNPRGIGGTGSSGGIAFDVLDVSLIRSTLTGRVTIENASLSGLVSGDALGTAFGIATLDASGNVPLSQMPFTSLTGITSADNTALGNGALASITSGITNSCLGVSALAALLDGNANSMFGYQAGAALTNQVNNTGFGYRAMLNYTGENGIGVGIDVMESATGINNIAFGQRSMRYATGSNNIAIGHTTMTATLFSGSYNIGIGRSTLAAVTTGTQNTVVGHFCGQSITTGSYNTGVGYSTFGNCNSCIAIGVSALEDGNGTRCIAIGNNTMIDLVGSADCIAIGTDCFQGSTFVGSRNVGLGDSVGYYTTSANDTTLVGWYAGHDIAANTGNTGMGAQAMELMQTGTYNCAFGYRALQDCRGSRNVGVGKNALRYGTADSNVAVGADTLTAATFSGTFNVAVGDSALTLVTTGNTNTAVGYAAGSTITTGLDNTLLGASASVTAVAAANRIVIGSGASGTTNNTCRIGNSSLTGGVESFGVYTNVSDARTKRDIVDNQLGLEFVRSVQTRNFRMIDGDPRLHFGVVAQELLSALQQYSHDESAMVKYSRDEDRYFVAYSELIAPMILAIQQLASRVDAIDGCRWTDGPDH